MGIAHTSSDAHALDEIFRMADVALHEVKARGSTGGMAPEAPRAYVSEQQKLQAEYRRAALEAPRPVDFASLTALADVFFPRVPWYVPVASISSRF